MSTEITVDDLTANNAAKVVEPAKSESDFDKLVSTLKGTSNVADAMYLPVNMFQDYVEIDLGPKGKKCISYQDFRNIIAKSLTENEAADITGLLPPSNMFFISIGAKNIYLSCYYPSSIRNLTFINKKMEVVTPNMIISHNLYKDGKDWVVRDSRFFCTDQPISKLPKKYISEPSPRDRIWTNPLSNTYSDARMCYGYNSMPARYKDDNLRGLDYYYKFLWETPFNTDLGIPSVGGGVQTWYSELSSRAKENKPFPYERLHGWTTHPDGYVPPPPIR